MSFKESINPIELKPDDLTNPEWKLLANCKLGKFTFTPENDKTLRTDQWEIFLKLTKQGYINASITNHKNGFLWQFERIK